MEKEKTTFSRDPRWVESTTLDIPQGLPMHFGKPTFYVRDCYPQYYEKAMRVLGGSGVVAVTGTPGVGTSTFFAYFFLRFSAENEESTVITTSFCIQAKSSVMTAVAVWKGGEMIERTKNRYKLYQLLDKAEKGAVEANSGVIHLCNGSPNFRPGAPMVCFTRLASSSCQPCPKLFMPLWDLKELQTAANELDRPVRKLSGCLSKTEPEDVRMVVDEVEQRLLMFGGVARECLSDDACFVDARKIDVERLISQLNSGFFTMRLIEDLEYEMVRFAAHHNYPRRAEITGPPQFAKRLLVAHLSMFDTAMRNKINDCLRASLVYGPITLDSTHPVNGESLALLLDRLGLMTMTREHPERVALIFVVPRKIAKVFERQEIELDVDIPNDEDSVLRLGKIGKMRKKALNDVGIHKIQDLRERLEEVEALRVDATTPLAQDLSIRFLRELLRKHDERQWLKEVLNSIPQFVWPFAY
ncbi:hypothetical protein PF001_g4382 [Phytophthora fragariae]|uniref:Uncharacterized protein n=1 Tax=Phytophthora fragariae TaxID=53985 RepID=A0A6A3UIV6_9STRA|nr:hypothetical protein PF003_g29434 [Phytophthora fragariae]KAE9151478.1 hypothetical protein PF006_g4228 [Phytophthora fragariae]KAE9322479.1 hypothetical protein PF001_g4382 [Phytophthora fragariae]